MQDKKNKDYNPYAVSKEEYVSNAVRALKEMYQAEGQEFNEKEARANAAADWEANQPDSLKAAKEKADSAEYVDRKKAYERKQIDDSPYFDGKSDEQKDEAAEDLARVSYDVAKKNRGTEGIAQDNANARYLEKIKNRNERINGALKSLLSGQAFKDRIGK